MNYLINFLLYTNYFLFRDDGKRSAFSMDRSISLMMAYLTISFSPFVVWVLRNLKIEFVFGLIIFLSLYIVFFNYLFSTKKVKKNFKENFHKFSYLKGRSKTQALVVISILLLVVIFAISTGKFLHNFPAPAGIVKEP